MPVFFSDRCLSVLDLANIVAQSLRRPNVGTEHVLLAMLQDGSGAAAALLKRAGVEAVAARWQIERLVPPEAHAAPAGRLLCSPSVQLAVDLAVVAASSRGHLYAGNQHLLL